jgi:hypothetical protein
MQSSISPNWMNVMKLKRRFSEIEIHITVLKTSNCFPYALLQTLNESHPQINSLSQSVEVPDI